MPKVALARDLNMSLNGYIRATLVAKIFNVSTSTVGKWPADKVKRIANGGLSWILWSDARAFRAVEADMMQLPTGASDVFKLAQEKAFV
jgi:hypothetical protein